jgi:DNA-binding transcriptional ArsR family regulator
VHRFLSPNDDGPNDDKDKAPPDPEAELLVRLGKGLGHPSRAAILMLCARRSPALQRPVVIARDLKLPLGVVSYHVRALADLGLLVLKAMTTVRGAVAHDYAAAEGVPKALDALMRAVRPPSGS